MLKSIRAETLPNPDSTTVTLSTKEAKRLGFSQIKSLYQIDLLTLMPKKPLLSFAGKNPGIDLDFPSALIT
jgi:hypothetical protein